MSKYPHASFYFYPKSAKDWTKFKWQLLFERLVDDTDFHRDPWKLASKKRIEWTGGPIINPWLWGAGSTGTNKIIKNTSKRTERYQYKTGGYKVLYQVKGYDEYDYDTAPSGLDQGKFPYMFYWDSAGSFLDKKTPELAGSKLALYVRHSKGINIAGDQDVVFYVMDHKGGGNMYLRNKAVKFEEGVFYPFTLSEINGTSQNPLFFQKGGKYSVYVKMNMHVKFKVKIFESKHQTQYEITERQEIKMTPLGTIDMNYSGLKTADLEKLAQNYVPIEDRFSVEHRARPDIASPDKLFFDHLHMREHIYKNNISLAMR